MKKRVSRETAELLKLPYLRPKCTVYPMEDESFCAISVHPKVPGSTTVDWEEEEEEDAGDVPLY